MEAKKLEFPTIAIWWDVAKAEIKTFAQAYASEKQSAFMTRFYSLQSDIYYLERFDPTSPSLAQKKEELSQYFDYEAEGAIIRSREKKQYLTDAPTDYFFSLEASKGARQTLNQVRNHSNGEIVTDPSSILKYASSFYSSLYTPTPVVHPVDLHEGLPSRDSA